MRMHDPVLGDPVIEQPEPVTLFLPMVSRRILSAFLLSALALAGCRRGEPHGAAPVRADPPGVGPFPVVLISLDTLRADRLNCYGYTRWTVSPHIDALAADSVVFENHLAASPWTIPSHMSLLTSLWPGSHGVTGSLAELSEDAADYPMLSQSRTTLAAALKAGGYQTAAFTAGETLEPQFGFGQGFQLYRTSMLKLDERNVGEMRAWVEQHRATPFFLFWHTFEMHAPYLGTSFLDQVLPADRAAIVRDAVLRYSEKMHAHGIHPARFETRLRKRKALTPEVSQALYMGSILDADRWVGTLLDDLKRLGLYDRALIVLTSDHGEEFRDHAPDKFYNAHGHSLFRELVRAPLVVKLPGGERAGTRVLALTRAVDVMPTVLDLLHQPPVAEAQGQSLRVLWERRGAESRVGFLESLEELHEAKGVETERYAYMVGIGAESVRSRGRAYLPPTPAWRALYDLRDDPRQLHNLLDGRAGAEHERLAETLDALLRRHLAEQTSDNRSGKLSPELIERLRSLGYVH